MALSRLSHEEAHIFASVVCHVCQILLRTVHRYVHTYTNTVFYQELTKSGTQMLKTKICFKSLQGAKC